MCVGDVSVGLGDVLAVADIALGTYSVAHVLHHGDALAVVAVGIAEAVVALLYLAHFVESRVSDYLRCRREHAFRGLGLGQGVDLGVVKDGQREDRSHLRHVVHLCHGLFRGHAAQGVVGRGAVQVLP